MLTKDRPRTGPMARLREIFRPLTLRLYAWKQELLVRLVPTMTAYHRLPLVGWGLRRLATLYSRTTYHTGNVAPYEVVRDLILSGARFSAAICACRKVWKHCDVNAIPHTCLYVGMAAETWEKYKKHETREIDKEEALRILDWCRNEHLVHAVWTCTTPQTYAICNCCPVDCAGMQVRKAGIPEGSRPSPFVSVTNLDLCNGCGQCVDFCLTYPFAARSFVEGSVSVDESRCVGCGVCRDLCPTEAIELRRVRDWQAPWTVSDGHPWETLGRSEPASSQVLSSDSPRPEGAAT